MHNRNMTAVDLRKILSKHASKWVLISRDYKRVLDSAKTLKGLLKAPKRERDGYVFRVAKDYSRYIG